ncbi:ATP-dependent DNA helicase [Methanimicrococcus blatticola]|uniref:DNA excision repair protein ERCC-2 n=1 Tax=Methanimicrococcus blatticola TaxID=91560 RepID=A0A484F5Q3_9EURY|nr:ATP-dependent DNA helicase [Methanimicrococcus blatticola]MCC2508438.1 ATP-dependent DNA helicase [Methanimicrococcus blatticola]TDQ70109.1 DNA excision repair protein ERCC-2 [Methanimicrococcus blatticola]
MDNEPTQETTQFTTAYNMKTAQQNAPGFMKYFTKPSCYPNQEDAMKQIAAALEKSEVVLFEGACGTGKTLSALAPALDVAEKQNKKVIIVTNVHQQMVQFINEARDIKRKTDIKVAVMKGKQSVCPDHLDYEECRAKTENTYELLEKERIYSKAKKELSESNERYKKSGDAHEKLLAGEIENDLKKMEPELQKKRERICPYLYEVLQSDATPFKKWIFDDVRSSEDIKEYADEKGMCGYELLKREMKYADLIICNYHHVLSQEIFLTLLGWIEKLPEDVIVIFDEAHNIENAARSHSSITISERVIERAINEIEEHDNHFPEKLKEDAQKIFHLFVESIRDSYEKTFGFGERNRIGTNWIDIQISDPYERFDYLKERFLRKIADYNTAEGKKLTVQSIQNILINVSEIGDEIESVYHENYKSGSDSVRRKSNIVRAANFIFAYMLNSENPNYYPILNIRRDVETNDIYGRVELFTCIPRNVTAPLFDSLGGLVLMSATFRPFDMAKETLGIERPTLEIAYPITFPPDHRRTFAVSVPPLYQSKRNHVWVRETVEQTLVSAICATQGNTIIYFQSFADAEKYYSFLSQEWMLAESGIKVLLDQPGVSSNTVREEFFKIGESGERSVLVSYIFGTLSEGIDYRDDRARSVIVVGIGYPALNDRTKAVEAAYDTVFGPGKGWNFVILIPTIRRIRQAMGRVVRSPTDYGVRILLDARFQKSSAPKLGKYSVFRAFPEEESSEFIDVLPIELADELEKFFDNFSEAD